MQKLVLILFISLLISGCTANESNIRNQIQKANYCTTKDDCIDAGGKCPFGCYNYVNKNEFNRIQRLLDSFSNECIYDCMMCPDVECVDNICEPVCN